LAILQIEDGVVAMGFGFVSGWEIDDKVTRVWEKFAAELPVELQAFVGRAVGFVRAKSGAVGVRGIGVSGCIHIHQ
jgi:hypothetical protein